MVSRTILILILCWPALLIGQISIRVFDDLGPISFASVYVHSTNQGYITDSIGALTIPWTYGDTMTISHIGYNSTAFIPPVKANAPLHVVLIPTIHRLEEIVLTAYPRQSIRAYTYHHVSTLKRKDIVKLSPHTAADILGQHPGVFIQKSQFGGGSPMIRGFATNRILYIIDGIRFNNAIFRSGNNHNIISLDPFAITQSTVIYGPGSVDYGSDAIGGVMRFKTFQPYYNSNHKNKFSLKSIIRGATASRERAAHTQVSISKHKWAIVSGLSFSDVGDLRMGSHGPRDYLRPSIAYHNERTHMDSTITNHDERIQTPSQYHQFNLINKVKIGLGRTWSIALGWYFSRTSDFARYDRHLQMVNNQPRYGRWDYGPQQWKMYRIELSRSESNAWFDAMSIKVAKQSFKESRIVRSFNDSIQFTQEDKISAYSLNYDFIKNSKNNINLYYGANWIYNKVQSTGVQDNILTRATTTAPSRYPNSNWHSVGAYINYVHCINPRIKLQLGARLNYEWLSAKFESPFYPLPFTEAHVKNTGTAAALGVTYQPQSTTKISGQISTGFRMPNVDDIGKIFDSTQGTVVVPNPDLSGERSLHFEVDLQQSWMNNLSLGCSVYHTVLFNAMERQDFLLNGQSVIDYLGVPSRVQAIQNLGKQKVIGGSFQLNYHPISWLSLSSHLSIQDGIDIDDQGTQTPTRHAAPAFGGIKAGVSTAHISCQLIWTYTSVVSSHALPPTERDKANIYALNDDGLPYAPAWHKLDARLEYTMDKNWLIRLAIENIFDKRYRPYSSGIAAPGRNIIVELQYRLFHERSSL